MPDRARGCTRCEMNEADQKHTVLSTAPEIRATLHYTTLKGPNRATRSTRGPDTVRGAYIILCTTQMGGFGMRATV